MAGAGSTSNIAKDECEFGFAEPNPAPYVEPLSDEAQKKAVADFGEIAAWAADIEKQVAKEQTEEATVQVEVQQGWVCPVCGAGVAPWQGRCGCTPPPVHPPYNFPPYPVPPPRPDYPWLPWRDRPWRPLIPPRVPRSPWLWDGQPVYC